MLIFFFALFVPRNTCFVLRLICLRFFVVTQTYGFHAPMHQDHQRYSSIALRGGDDSFMEPDLLAVRKELS